MPKAKWEIHLKSLASNSKILKNGKEFPNVSRLIIDAEPGKKLCVRMTVIDPRPHDPYAVQYYKIYADDIKVLTLNK